MTTALVLHNAAAVSVTVEPSAEEAKAKLLAMAADITAIGNGFELELAANMARSIRAMVASVEDARKEIKAPVLDLGKRIDTVARDFSATLANELDRLTRLINTFTVEQRRLAEEAERKPGASLPRCGPVPVAASEQAAREAEAARLKAQREQEAAFTKEQEEQARIEWEKRESEARAEQERQRQLQAEKARLQTSPVVAPVKPAGVAAQKVWRYEVTDVYALYAHNANLVTVEPRAAAIMAAIRGGMRECPGLKIWQEDSTVIRR